MQAAISRVLFLAVALAAAALVGCADVHQNPASTAVTAQAGATDAPAAQVAEARSPTNVPF